MTLSAQVRAGIALLFGLAFTLQCARLAEAQPAHATRSEAHALAAVCASEQGLRVERYRRLARSFRIEPQLAFEGECAALSWALITRARRLRRDLLWHVRAFSSMVFEQDRRGRRWLAFLTFDDRRPQHWPRGPSWARHAAGWATQRRVAQEVLAGERPNPCREAAEGWGGSVDRHRIARMEASGWRRAHCGPTRNVFLVPPRRRSPRARGELVS